ncbi:putative reverse transcriptase zinc-binding domain-containing protein [Helianthus annuus]|nr:putative reverse transcriptase zinc-binding domain-containing protein [Helianthus annuus]
MSDIYDYDWKGGPDDWSWKADDSGVFSVNKAKKLITNFYRPNNNVQMKWKGWVPLKCKIMVWRVLLNRLPTRVELIKRGITLPSDSCILCDSELETTIHLFTGCFFSAEIWSRIEFWCRLSPIYAFDVSD